jgi:hypothetical protein
MGRIGALRRSASEQAEPQRVSAWPHPAMSPCGDTGPALAAPIWLPIVVCFG